MFHRSFFATVLFLSMTSLCNAGSIIEFDTKQLQSNPPLTGTVRISSQGAMTRMDVSAPDGGGSATMIFNGAAEELTIVDPEQTRYFVMTREQMDAMAVQMTDAMKQMETALAAMPPEQRAMAEKMMQSRMPAAPPARPASTVARSGGSQTVAGYDCENYSVTSEGRMIREMCVTDWDEIEGGQEVADALMDFADFFANMREAFSGIGGMADVSHQQDIFEHLKALGGYPVLSREFDAAGTLTGESRVTSARQENIDASVFMPPAGYQKQEMF